MPQASWPRCWSACRPERGDGRRLGVAKNAEDPAFLAESVVAVPQIAWALKLRIAKLFGLVEPLQSSSPPAGAVPLPDKMNAR